MLTVLRILAIASLPLTIASSGLQGLVACFGPDGSLALEVGDEQGCFCPTEDHCTTSEAPFPVISSPASDADCVCLPLSAEWEPSFARSITLEERRGEPLQRICSKVLFEPAMVAPPPGSSAPARDEQSPTRFFHFALRTIVLLT